MVDGFVNFLVWGTFSHFCPFERGAGAGWTKAIWAMLIQNQRISKRGFPYCLVSHPFYWDPCIDHLYFQHPENTEIQCSYVLHIVPISFGYPKSKPPSLIVDMCCMPFNSLYNVFTNPSKRRKVRVGCLRMWTVTLQRQFQLIKRDYDEQFQ